MVTLTTLAESKCSEPCSQQSSAWPESSTATATTETRPRSAARIPLVSLAASAGWEDDRQMAAETAAVLTVAPAAAAGDAISADPQMTVATPLTNPLIGRIAIPPEPAA
jgi:hypothetical protein